MKPLPVAEWLRSLDRMEASLADTSQEVERHAADVAELLVISEQAAALDSATNLLGKLDDRLAEHDRRLAAASEAAAGFDDWLTEQETSVARWQDAFTRWCGRIQKR